MFNYASLTKNGAALITRAVNGEKFIFTRMEYGSGIPSEFNDSQTGEEIKSILSERTSLVSKKADIGMYSISTKNNCATLTGKIISSSLTEDFLAKELGVFGKIGEETEVLVAYFIAIESPDFIKKEELVGQDYKIIVDVATGNAADITIEYSPEIYATKEDFDAAVAQNAEEHTALQQSITDLEASVDEKIGSIDISASLTDVYNTINNEASERQNADIALQSAVAVRKSYDFVVDSNETLLAWANCTDGSMKSVLVKSGEYTLDGKMINLVNAGTKFVFAEDGNKINITNYFRGIGATENYGAVVVGLNVELEDLLVTNETYAFYRGMICYNCTGCGTGNVNGTGFYNCTCSNCNGTGTAYRNSNSYGNGYGFYNCTCSNCIGTGTANGTGYGAGYGAGFYNCTCSNCTGTGNGSGSVDGFAHCTCSNCTGTGNGRHNNYGFAHCTCSNCTGTANGGVDGYGFYDCTCSNCTGTGTGNVNGTGFYNCKHCSSCRAGDTASTTATWGGSNTYIDSDSCDYVAA